MPTEKVSRVILQYEIQKQKLQEIKQANADLKKDLQGLDNSTAQLDSGFKKNTVTADQFNGKLTDMRARLEALKQGNAEARAEFAGLNTEFTKAYEGAGGLAGRLALVRDELVKTKNEASDVALPSVDSLTGDGGGGVGGRGGTFGIKSFGSNLKGLPAVQIPGLGISSDAIGKISQLLGSLSPTAIAAGGAVGVLSVALIALTNNAKAAKEAADAELESRKRAVELITTGSKEEIQARINALEKQRQVNQAVADDANKLLTYTITDITRNTGVLGYSVANFNSTIGTGAGELTAAREAADKANKAVNETSTELQLLQQASGLSAQSVADLAAQEKQLAEVRKKLSDLSSNAADLKQILDLEATGTSVDQVQELADAKRREIKVNEFYLKAAQDLAAGLDKNSQAYKDVTAEADKYRDAIARDTNFINRLSQGTFEIVGAREREQKTIAATTKYTEEAAKAQEDYAKKRADIEDKAAQKAIDLANKKADAEEAALQKLVDRVASLNLAAQRAAEDASTKAQRADLDSQVKFQRQEAKAAREHAQNLIKIKQDENAKAEDLIAARDFSGLFRLRRDTNIQIQQENEKYSQQAADRIEAFNQERNDRLLQFEREAADRLTKYNRDLVDARSQYNRELIDARNKYTKALELQRQATIAELNTLQTKYSNEVRLRQQGIQQELQLLQNGNIARVQLQQQFNNQMLALAQQLVQGNFGGTANASASAGGFLGVPASTNNSNSASIGSMNFNINGSNAAGIASAVNNAVRQQLAFMLGK